MPSVMNTCSPKSDSTDSYIFLSRNSSFAEKHVFCHQTPFHCNCFICTDILVLLSTFMSAIQSPVADFKIQPMVHEGLMNCMESLYYYVCFS